MSLIAFISDVHANLVALEAVVAEIQAARPDAVYVLGDMVNGCPWPAETLELLLALGWPMLMGNHDDAVLQLGTPRMEERYADRNRYAALWWTREHLAPRHLAVLEQAPLELSLAQADAPPLRLIHGLPGNFFVGFRPDSPEAWVVRHLSPVAEGTVVGGHTHVPMARRFGRWFVINSGAVGASYDGDPRAVYVLLEGNKRGWRAEIHRVAYDLDAVDAGYRNSGLLAEGGVMGEMFRRSVLSGLPWVADFAWWLRNRPAEAAGDVQQAQHIYDARHGPGRWAWPWAG